MNDKLIDSFADSLWLSEGLARNTLESYRRDARQFDAWLDKRGKALTATGENDLREYLVHQVLRLLQNAFAPRSRMVSPMALLHRP